MQPGEIGSTSRSPASADACTRPRNANGLEHRRIEIERKGQGPGLSDVSDVRLTVDRANNRARRVGARERRLNVVPDTCRRDVRV